MEVEQDRDRQANHGVDRWLSVIAAAAALAVFASACGSSPSSHRRSVFSERANLPSVAPLTGAGSALIAPLMAKWRFGYSEETGARVTYRTIGGSADIRPVATHAVDFGASDAPLTPVQFGEGRGVIEMIPWALTATVVVYHLRDAPSGLRLNARVLTEIFFGEITAWNDPAITSLNPGVNLPSTKITPIYRKDENGDDYALTDFLAAASHEFRSKAGISLEFKFPAGVGVEKSGGVSTVLGRTNGTIGYTSLPFAHSHKLNIASIENSGGSFPEPSAKSIEAAAKAGSSFGPNNETYVAPLPQKAKGAYPIAAYIFAVVPVESGKSEELKRFISYAISQKGQSYASALGFAQLPPQAVAVDKSAIRAINGQR